MTIVISPEVLARCKERLAAALHAGKSLKEWDESLHPRVPGGSGDPSGEWTYKDEAIAELAKPAAKPGSDTVLNVAKRFAKGGPRDLDDDKNVQRAIELAEQEIHYQLGLEGSEKYVGWYDKDFQDALAITAQHIPSLKTDKAKQILFAVVGGICANGEKPVSNWFIASQIFEAYEKTGVFPPLQPDGSLWGRRPAIRDQLTSLNKMMATLGAEGTLKWLTSEQAESTRELARQWFGGLKPDKSPEQAHYLDRVGQAVHANATTPSAPRARGYIMFGPKVGPFISNMQGIQSVTIDKWMARGFGRYFKMTFRDEDDRSPGTTSFGDRQRRVAIRVVSEAAKRTGLKPQEAQAVLWFFEQGLYTHLGARDKIDQFYSDGARKYDKWVRAGRKPIERKPRKKAIETSVPVILDKDIEFPPLGPEQMQAYAWVADLLRRRLGIDPPLGKKGYKAWDPDKHPRVPAGHGDPGGEFKARLAVTREGKGLKFNPHHRPAGSPNSSGGEFAPADAGEGGPYVPTEEYNQRVLLAMQTARKLGHPDDKINFSAEEKEFTLEDTKYKMAGEAHIKIGGALEPGQIMIYPNSAGMDIQGVTAHEVGHIRFQGFINAYEAERIRMHADPATLENMRPDGTLRETSRDGSRTGLAKKYPLYTKFAHAMGTAVAPKGSRIVTTFNKLVSDDGVTDYSRKWWKAYQNHHASAWDAMHETFAELSRMDMQEIPFLGVKPSWAKFYRDVTHWRENVKKP